MMMTMIMRTLLLLLLLLLLAMTHIASGVLCAAQQWPPFHTSLCRHSTAHAPRRPLPVMRVDAPYPPSCEQAAAL